MLDPEVNRALRDQGWRVFRSSTRDHLVPVTGLGRTLQRIVFARVLPDPTVREGIALSTEEQAQQARLREGAFKELTATVDQPLGIMKYIHFDVTNQDAGVLLGAPTDSEIEVGVAPFDGWLREVLLDGSNSGATLPHVAIRTSGGGTFFQSFSQNVSPDTTSFLEPDFVRLNTAQIQDRRVILRGGKVPVFAGERIFVVLRDINQTAAFILRVVGSVGFEAVILARAGSAAAQSQFLALIGEERAATRLASAQATAVQIESIRLAQEREKTERAKVAAQAAQVTPRSSTFDVFNPFQQVLTLESAQPTVQRAASPPPPAPRVIPPKPAPPEGAGKTFVPAWVPTTGSIGYLIPEPKAGQRVTVFDNKFTVWDVTGRAVSSGPVEMVSAAQGIPEGSRVSRELRG